MRHPWHALTRLLTAGDPPGDFGDPWYAGGPQLKEAWTETAARMGLIRLGWWSLDEPQGRSPALAYPTVRAVERAFEPTWRRQQPPEHTDRRSRCGAEEERLVGSEFGVLAAASPMGRMPSRAALMEVATLALALGRKEALLAERAGSRERLVQARATAAAGHDLRNELTRALLFAGRGEDGDGQEVLRALSAARDLAQSALLAPGHGGGGGGGAPVSFRPVELRGLLTEEVSGAAAAARVPVGRAPAVRLKVPRGLFVLCHEPTLRRAVRNVVLNGMEAIVRARRSPGALWVSVEQSPERSPSGYDVKLVVRDEGTGMDADQTRTFLAPRTLRRGPDDGSEHLRSTGLGTASLAQALETGSITLGVRSRRREGTTVELGLRSVDPADPEVEVIVDADVRRARRRVAARRALSKTAWAVRFPEHTNC